MQEQVPLQTPRIRVQKKHKVMFILACVLVIVGVLAQLLSIVGVVAYVQNMLEDYNNADHSEEALPGLGTLIMGFGSILYLFAGLVASVVVRDVIWAAGLVLSAILTFRKKLLPMPMWVISLLLFIFYAWFIIGDLLRAVVSIVVTLIFRLLGA